jgi:hypothetical protein
MKLHEAVIPTTVGKTAEEACTGFGIGPATCRRWRTEQGGESVETVRGHKALKEENARW